ncbi:MAG TPA: hypothetical protein VFW44_16215 [Bryobacteraceae bacterium]|nr:hypothetical protein [Bryobacteraceae bacterium]
MKKAIWVLSAGLAVLSLPVAAATTSFSFNMSGIAPPVGGPAGSTSFPAQTASGDMAPFGSGRVAFSSDQMSVVFSLADGTTLTASIVATPAPDLSSNIQGTITGGSGILLGATGNFQGALTPDTAHVTQAGLPFTFMGSGSLTAPDAPGGLSVLPGKLVLANSESSTASQNLILNNQGFTDAPFKTSFSTATGGNWLTLSAASGTVAAAQTFAIAVNANKAGLKNGVYRGQITIVSGTLSVDVPVLLVVGGAGSNLLLSETGLDFQATLGGSAPAPQSLTIINTGTGSLTGLAAKTSVTGSGVNWLKASVDVDPHNSQLATSSITIGPLPSVSGIYYGKINYTLNGAANSPQVVTVVLEIGAGALPTVSRTGLEFDADYSGASLTVKGDPPKPQTVTVTNNGKAELSYSINTGNSKWIDVSPTGPGSIGPGGSVTLTVQMDAKCVSLLACGIGDINTAGFEIDFPQAGYMLGVGVLYSLFDTDNFTPPPLARSGRRSVPGCTPSWEAGVLISIPDGFRATVGLPVPLEVSLIDSCAERVTSGTVVASFSNNDPPVTLNSIGGGMWTGTWTPRSAAPSATVTVTMSEGGTGGRIEANGAVASNTSTPLVASGGAYNAASGVPVIAPGAFVAVYGSNLASGSNTAKGPRFPPALGGTQVLLGGTPVPLYFTSTGQIDAIVPYDIATDTTLQVVVQNGDALSQPETVLISRDAPAVFTQDQSGSGPGAILVQKANGAIALNTSANPASKGDALEIFSTGLGAVNPPVTAGSAASTTVLSRTDDEVTVTVGGQSAQVLFAGLAPGFVGLYQVNVLMPAGVAPGNSVPVILSQGDAVSPTVTVSVK